MPSHMIDHTGYTEPAAVARVRDRYGAQEIPAHEALRAALAARPQVSRDQVLSALAAADPNEAAAVLAEFDRLAAVEHAWLDALTHNAWQEACRWAPELKYPLVRLADDAYIAWVGSADAPTRWTMTAEQARERGYPAEQVQNAKDARDGRLFNRAGPGGKPLTVAAIIEAYASGEAHRAFRLTPEKISCGTTSEMSQDPTTGQWVESEPFWSPWAPDAVPDTLPKGWPDRF